VVAHVHGVARAIENRDWLLDMLNRLTDAHEDRLGTVRELKEETSDEVGLMAALVMTAIDADTPGRS
jgi:transcriptional regulator